MNDPGYAIPNKLNVVIAGICVILYAVFLIILYQLESIGMAILTGIFLAILMIPVYSLMHEGAHMTLHDNKNWNEMLCLFLCLIFIVPPTFFRHCHLKHHKKNRTDEEMWDLYYEHQSKWQRYGNLYGMMLGLGYFALWIAVFLCAFVPSLLNSRFLHSHTEISGFLRGSDASIKLRKSTLESWLIIVVHALLFYFLELHFIYWIIAYAIHGLSWASQNYVNHAFSPRDIVNGAHNLKNPFGKVLYLNFNLHKAHHQHPHISWIHLPKIVRDKKRISYYSNYLELWKGPKLTKEPSPRETC